MMPFLARTHARTHAHTGATFRKRRDKPISVRTGITAWA